MTLALDAARAQAGLGADHPAVLLAMGACLENLVQAATRAGLPPAQMQFPGGDHDAFLRISAAGGESVPDAADTSYFTARHTSRVPFSRDPLPSTLLDELQESREGKAQVRVFSAPAQIACIAGLIEAASQARFQNAEIHRWLVASLRLSESQAAQGDGLDVATLGLPPGGRLLMRLIADWRRMSVLNKLGAYKLLAKVEALSVAHCGAVLAVMAPTWGTPDMLSAGRLLERIWLLLNHQGIAVHPYFVLSDQLYRRDTGRLPPAHVAPVNALAGSSRTVFRDGDLQPAVLLRVGRTAAQVPRSRRLPIAQVFASSVLCK
ncbi:hypothetical protein [uncultured Thiodictyon sp.]|uniref:hypothetical protein n=1 Tax=uncultured Thiodictyon sp. TaxID=1846217 RepID=UPI0025F0F7CF|nr:hypothetical protein [uncultured Thiodictyon sp.]